MLIDSAHGEVAISELRVHLVTSDRGRDTVTGITVDGQLCVPTRQFWQALAEAAGIDGIDGWVTPGQLLAIVKAFVPRLRMRYCIAWDASGNAIILPGLM